MINLVLINLVDKEEGLKIAGRYRPVVVQRFEDIRDLITPMHFGEFVPDLLDEPCAYYSVRRYADKPMMAVSFNFFHPHDWSKTGFGLRDLLDEHKFDFEGVYYLISLNGGESWTITQAHYRLIFSPGIRRRVFIEPQGHAIRPKPKKGGGNVVVYKDYPLERLEDYEASSKGPLNRTGVHWPNQVNDSRIERRFGSRTDGMVHWDPAQLIQHAKRLRLIEN